MSGNLGAIEHVVVLMLENRSFDHMLGFLYADAGNTSPSGEPFDGLGGDEANPDPSGAPVRVFRITPDAPNAYRMPGADPGEGYLATNQQLFGQQTAPTPPIATNSGFVTDFASTLAWEARSPRWGVLAGTTAKEIMGMYTPAMLPVLSGLARGFAVCDRWFAPVPTETLPNRAFALAATSQGHMDDKTKTYTCPSIFGLLSGKNVDWRIYGYDTPPLTRHNFPDSTNASEDHFGVFTDFQAAAAGGRLPPFGFLEPSWGAAGNSQHPNYDVAAGEQLIHDVYQAVRNGPGWNQTLLVITYDEHGGCYDHVPPPAGAAPPDASAGEFGFDFRRFGVRVPAVLVSPWIQAGRVFRAPAGAAPLDHTSILATVQKRWGLASLTSRDAAAHDLGDLLTEPKPRTDDPLAGVRPPARSQAAGKQSAPPSHMQRIQAELVSTLPVPSERKATTEMLGGLRTSADYDDFVRRRTASWISSRRR